MITNKYYYVSSSRTSRYAEEIKRFTRTPYKNI